MDLHFKIEVVTEEDGEIRASVWLVNENGNGQPVWLSPADEQWSKISTVKDAQFQARDDFAKALAAALSRS